MKKLVIPLVLLLVLGGTFLFLKEQRVLEDKKQLRASGTIEVTEVQVTPQIGGRIRSLNLREGSHVQQGDLVVKLSIDGLDAKKEYALAQLEQAEARLRELKAGNREEEIREYRENVRALAVKQEQALLDARRYAKLLESEIVSKQEAEQYAENARIAKNQLQGAKEHLRLLEKGTRPEVIQQQEQAVKSARASLQMVETDLAHKEVPAPISGLVLSKNYEVGEVVAAGAPIATLGDMRDCWVKLYLPSTQIGLIRVGGETQVRVDSYPDRVFIGTVREISGQAEYNPRLSLTQEERANQIFWVKVTLSNDEGIMKPGMPADVVFAP